MLHSTSNKISQILTMPSFHLPILGYKIVLWVFHVECDRNRTTSELLSSRQHVNVIVWLSGNQLHIKRWDLSMCSLRTYAFLLSFLWQIYVCFFTAIFHYWVVASIAFECTQMRKCRPSVLHILGASPNPLYQTQQPTERRWWQCRGVNLTEKVQNQHPSNCSYWKNHRLHLGKRNRNS